MTEGILECRQLAPLWKHPLLAFLHDVETTDGLKFFHPHPFTDEGIGDVLRLSQKDLYYLLIRDERILGYGMLRGWDEGYEIPSLGIAIHPQARGLGLGMCLITFLHAAAKLHGAAAVRLRVKSENSRAIRLYERLGYRFAPEKGEFLIGFLELAGKKF